MQPSRRFTASTAAGRYDAGRRRPRPGGRGLRRRAARASRSDHEAAGCGYVRRPPPPPVRTPCDGPKRRGRETRRPSDRPRSRRARSPAPRRRRVGAAAKPSASGGAVRAGSRGLRAGSSASVEARWRRLKAVPASRRSEPGSAPQRGLAQAEAHPARSGRRTGADDPGQAAPTPAATPGAPFEEAGAAASTTGKAETALEGRTAGATSAGARRSRRRRAAAALPEPRPRPRRRSLPTGRRPGRAPAADGPAPAPRRRRHRDRRDRAAGTVPHQPPGRRRPERRPRSRPCDGVRVARSPRVRSPPADRRTARRLPCARNSPRRLLRRPMSRLINDRDAHQVQGSRPGLRERWHAAI